MATGARAGGYGPPTVETESGKVRGKVLNDCLAFLGIPYARAERFRAPVPFAPWSGIRDCMAFGASAPQTNPDPSTTPPAVILARLPRTGGAPARPEESESCQVLNIWTASADPGARRPVMIWLHGGFFSSGSGSGVDGSSLARRDVVVVSLNHRVNAFGFTDLSAFASEFGESANAGMLDIVAALRWTRDNIASFGGDPARVTVFGTSGGGMKTSVLMDSPLAKGLLHRAAVHSGPGLRFLTRDEVCFATERLIQEAGLTAANAGALARLPVEDLLRAYHRTAAAMPPSRFIDLPCFAPVIDGQVMERQPFAPNAGERASEIPMIVGSNTDEMSFFMGNDLEGFSLGEEAFERRVSDLAPGKAEAICTHYRASMPDATPSQRWIRMFSDYSIMLPTIAQARRHAAASDGGTWLYRLGLSATAFDGKLGATHTLETPLIFDAPGTSPLLAGHLRAAKVADMMSGHWAHFAAHGAPGPDWPAYDDGEAVMAFEEASAVRRRLGMDEAALLYGLLDA